MIFRLLLLSIFISVNSYAVVNQHIQKIFKIKIRYYFLDFCFYQFL